MAKDKHTAQLQKVAIFSGLTTRELSVIELATDEVEVRAGDVIVSEGDEGHDFYLISSGQASVTRGGKRVATLGPSQYFGELSLLDGAPRSATVRADTDMSLVKLHDREFSAVLDEWPGVAHKLLVQMAARLRAADDEAVTH